MLFKLINTKSDNIPFIPIHSYQYNTKIININMYLSKYLEFLYINQDFLETIKNNSNIKLIKISKNDIFFGYIGVFQNKKYFENNFYWKWMNIVYNADSDDDLIFDNIIYNVKNDQLEYITIREIYKNLFKD